MKCWCTLLLLLIVGGLTPGLAQDSKKRELEVFFISLNKVAQAGDKTGYTGLFSPSAVMFVPNRAPLLGRDQIGDWFEDFRKTVELITATYEQEHIDIVGDVALVRSHATGHYLVKSTEERIPFSQKYVDILRYDQGKWLMLYHVASSTSPEPGLWDRPMSQEFGFGAGGPR